LHYMYYYFRRDAGREGGEFRSEVCNPFSLTQSLQHEPAVATVRVDALDP